MSGNIPFSMLIEYGLTMELVIIVSYIEIKLNRYMDEEKKLALLGFHATTGNDYVSSFFRRGKEKSWKILEKFSRFMTMFARLGDTWDLSEEHLELLEEFVCHLYGGKVTRLMHLGTKSIETFIVLRTKYKTYLYLHLVGDL